MDENTKLVLDFSPFFAKATFEYSAQDEGEANFLGGDVLKIVGENEYGWWLSQQVDGSLGWVPSNYFDKLGPVPEDLDALMQSHASEIVKTPTDDIVKPVQEFPSNALKKSDSQAPPPPPTPPRLSLEDENSDTPDIPKKRGAKGLVQARLESMDSSPRPFDAYERGGDSSDDEDMPPPPPPVDILDQVDEDKEQRDVEETSSSDDDLALVKQRLIASKWGADKKSEQGNEMPSDSKRLIESGSVKSRTSESEICAPHPRGRRASRRLRPRPKPCSICTKVIHADDAYFSLGNSDRCHQWCLVCSQCSGNLSPETIHEVDGKYYCAEDFAALSADRCGACEKPVTAPFLKAMGKSWHRDCFVCKNCTCEFTNGKFRRYEDQPYCTACFTMLFAAQCSGCGNGISTGITIRVGGLSFHQACFVCAWDGHSMAPATPIRVIDNKSVCTVHADAYHKKVNRKCEFCGDIPKGIECVEVEERVYHRECFRCSGCDMPIPENDYEVLDGYVYGKSCCD